MRNSAPRGRATSRAPYDKVKKGCYPNGLQNSLHPRQPAQLFVHDHE
jgi:hypothetical protein